MSVSEHERLLRKDEFAWQRWYNAVQSLLSMRVFGMRTGCDDNTCLDVEEARLVACTACVALHSFRCASTTRAELARGVTLPSAWPGPEAVSPQSVAAFRVGPNDQGALWFLCVEFKTRGCASEEPLQLVPIPRAVALTYARAWATRRLRTPLSATLQRMTFRADAEGPVARVLEDLFARVHQHATAPTKSEIGVLPLEGLPQTPPLEPTAAPECVALAPLKACAPAVLSTRAKRALDENDDERFVDELSKRVEGEGRASLTVAELYRLRQCVDEDRLRDVVALERGSMNGLRTVILTRLCESGDGGDSGDGDGVVGGDGDGCAASGDGRARLVACNLIPLLSAESEAALAAYQPLCEFASATSATIKKATPLVRPMLADELIDAYRRRIESIGSTNSIGSIGSSCCSTGKRAKNTAYRRLALSENRNDQRFESTRGEEATSKSYQDRATLMLILHERQRLMTLSGDRPGEANVANRLRDMCRQTWERDIVKCARNLGYERARELLRAHEP